MNSKGKKRVEAVAYYTTTFGEFYLFRWFIIQAWDRGIGEL
jgi:hypothetical protein